jgi:hypothetical protein
MLDDRMRVFHGSMVTLPIDILEAMPVDQEIRVDQPLLTRSTTVSANQQIGSGMKKNQALASSKPKQIGTLARTSDAPVATAKTRLHASSSTQT